MENASELKSCPFCGGEAGIKQYAIKCCSCYCSICHTETRMSDRDTVIAIWNARTQSPESSGLVALDEDELMKLLIKYHKQCYPEDWKEPDIETTRMITANKDIVKIICSKFGTQQSKLVPLSEKELTKLAIVHLEQNKQGFLAINAETFIKAICRMFGSPSVPSLEEIEKIIKDINSSDNQEHGNWGIKEKATAIHRLLTNGSKNE